MESTQVRVSEARSLDSRLDAAEAEAERGVREGATREKRERKEKIARLRAESEALRKERASLLRASVKKRGRLLSSDITGKR